MKNIFFYIIPTNAGTKPPIVYALLLQVVPNRPGCHRSGDPEDSPSWSRKQLLMFPMSHLSSKPTPTLKRVALTEAHKVPVDKDNVASVLQRK